jgi:hypothetical protein
MKTHTPHNNSFKRDCWENKLYTKFLIDISFTSSANILQDKSNEFLVVTCDMSNS